MLIIVERNIRFLLFALKAVNDILIFIDSFQNMFEQVCLYLWFLCRYHRVSHILTNSNMNRLIVDGWASYTPQSLYSPS